MSKACLYLSERAATPMSKGFCIHI
jgi:hypothetical protein